MASCRKQSHSSMDLYGINSMLSSLYFLSCLSFLTSSLERERERERVCFVLFCEYQHMLSVKQFCCMYCSVCLLSHTQTLVLLSNAHSSFQLIFLILFSCRSLFFIWKNYTYTHQLPFTYQLPLQTTTRDT